MKHLSMEEVVIKIVSLSSIIGGTGLLLGDKSKYSSGSYDVAFQILNLHTWGLLFLLCGLLPLVWHKAYSTIPFTILGTCWAIALWAAVVQHKAQTLAGPIWITGIVAMFTIAGMRTER